eukprot:gene12184-8385_t
MERCMLIVVRMNRNMRNILICRDPKKAYRQTIILLLLFFTNKSSLVMRMEDQDQCFLEPSVSRIFQPGCQTIEAPRSSLKGKRGELCMGRLNVGLDYVLLDALVMPKGSAVGRSKRKIKRMEVFYFSSYPEKKRKKTTNDSVVASSVSFRREPTAIRLTCPNQIKMCFITDIKNGKANDKTVTFERSRVSCALKISFDYPQD